VRSAEEALTRLEDDANFDLLLLDYSLQGELTGLAVFLIMKERGFSAPAILITGFEDPKIIVQAMRAGVRDFLPKTADYLDDLPLAVERVLRQVSLEQQVAESQAIKEKQELLEAAFDGARLAAFVWDIARNEFRCMGHFEDIFGQSKVSDLVDLKSFLSLISPSDAELVRRALDEARETKEGFECQFRVFRDDGSQRWVYANGRFQYGRDGEPVRMICVMNDISGRKRVELELLQSHEKIKALNERLQMGMVETNHRVKNHLQKLISLVQYQSRARHGSLNEEDVQNVISHIHGLAALHDVLADEVRANGDGLSVDAADVLGKVMGVIGGAADGRLVQADFQGCRVTARQAASLSVILNELLANALKHGHGEVQVGLTCSNGTGELSVLNEGSAFPEGLDVEKTGRTGLLLVKLLCKSDFGTEPLLLNNSGNQAQVIVRFPLPEIDSCS
jgi:PAS domain S-box-containing protein